MVVKRKSTSAKKKVARARKTAPVKKVVRAKKSSSVKKAVVKRVLAKKPVATKRVASVKKVVRAKKVIVKESASPLKKCGCGCVYSHEDVDRLLDSTPKFSRFYHIMTGFVYAGIMVIVWSFVYYAYTIDKPIYDLFCVDCKAGAIVSIKLLVTAWLFALYFYFLCELRCRAWDMCLMADKVSVKKSNKWILAMSVLFTGLTAVFFWF